MGNGNRPPQWEFQDAEGTTDSYVSNVGTSAVSVPATPGGRIAHVFVKNPLGTAPYNKILYYSFDAGTTWFELRAGEYFIWPVRGILKQIQIKGSVAVTPYEIILNREET